MEPGRTFGRPRTLISTGVMTLASLLLGFALGYIAYITSNPLLLQLLVILEPIGTLWVNALRMTVIPLTFANLVFVVVSMRSTRSVGKLGGLSLATFLGLLVLGGIFSLSVTPAFVALIPADPTLLSAPAGVETPPSPADVPSVGRTSGSIWTGLVRLFPTNPVQAAAEGQLLQLIVFAILFGLAATRLPAENRRLLTSVFEAVTGAMVVMVRAVLSVAPIGVFALSFGMVTETGLFTISAVAYYIPLVCGCLLAFTLVLYPIAALVGGVPVRRFARAVAPAQVVAVGTRSSLASLPSLLEGAARHLPASRKANAFTLPLAVAVFKQNTTISGPVRLLLLAHLYGIPLDPVFVLGFMLFLILVSFGYIGIPGGGGAMLTLPAFLAAGIPIEAVLLFEAVEAIPDIFFTLVNVTADMTATTIVGRLAHEPAGGGVDESLLAPAAPAGPTGEVLP
jgi:Na+/H+-dicarboxylate symporter